MRPASPHPNLHDMLAKNGRLRLSSASQSMHRPILPTAVALVLFTLLGFGSHAAAAPLHADQMLNLPDGREVKVLSVSKFEYEKGVMALMVRYETKLSIDQRKELSDEVDQVWRLAQKDVDHLGYSEAILSSNEVPKGIFLTASRTMNFIYEKGANGEWTRLNRADFMALQ
jgi:hypothetical protein